MMKTLSIIIPVFNERKTLKDLLFFVEKSYVPDIQKEIILIDDCSTDGTREFLKELCTTGKYKVLFQEKNLGKGACVRRGLAQATGEYVLIQDADLEYDPSEYSRLLQPLVNGKTSVVYGSRLMGDVSRGSFTFIQYGGNRVLTTLSNICTGLHLTDMETCYKMFTRESMQTILPYLKSDRFGIEPEITALLAFHNIHIEEVGISYTSRTHREGKKIGWLDGLSAVWVILFSTIRLHYSYKK